MEVLKIIIDELRGKASLISALRAICPNKKLTYTHVNNWLGRDNKVPAGWVIPVSKAIDYRYTPHQIRPDIYPHPHDGLPEHLRLPIEDAA